MNTLQKPDVRPANPNFSSGPCSKRPGWSPDVLANAFLGRSHRHATGKKLLAEVIERTRDVLGIPADYHIGIVPASDTGAIEMALWSVLGPRGVEVLSWESFGSQWAVDVQKQLKLDDIKLTNAEYGEIPDLSKVDFSRDVIFTWNGTTGGVKVPDGDWIPADREGLTIVDGTSAVFAMDIPWDKVDICTWSWQKAMGGEAAHGMLVLSPRAVERIESYDPPWPMPKVFRLKKKDKLNEDVFKGLTINTPSMLCVEDAIDGLKWAEGLGGLKALLGRVQANFKALSTWVEGAEWIDFICKDPAARSDTSVVLVVTDPWFTAMDEDAQRGFIKKLTGLLDDEGTAFDVGSHRDAPPGLRIWCGATVETSDLEALGPWLDWAFHTVKAQMQEA
ncbi:MAG: phosphoserine transaminase [Rhodospirillales bacterium]|nr:phosphoserine transaminase [Rhodospirillales bacterium]MBO6786195.1 phosphoserine transaminase [Rhodospirillales bacterium]